MDFQPEDIRLLDMNIEFYHIKDISEVMFSLSFSKGI